MPYVSKQIPSIICEERGLQQFSISGKKSRASYGLLKSKKLNTKTLLEFFEFALITNQKYYKKIQNTKSNLIPLFQIYLYSKMTLTKLKFEKSFY